MTSLACPSFDLPPRRIFASLSLFLPLLLSVSVSLSLCLSLHLSHVGCGGVSPCVAGKDWIFRSKGAFKASTKSDGGTAGPLSWCLGDDDTFNRGTVSGASEIALLLAGRSAISNQASTAPTFSRQNTLKIDITIHRERVLTRSTCY